MAIANCKKQFAGVYAQVTIVLCPRLSVLRIKNLSCPLGLQSQPITHFMTNIINGERERTGTFRHFFYTFKHTFQTKAEVIPSRNASGRRWRRFVVEHPLKSLARRIWPNFPGLFTKRIGNIVVFPALCKPR